VADHERGALARRQAVDHRRHAALLELPQQEVALRIAERAHDVGAGRLAAQGLVERFEVDLGLARQPLLEQPVRECEQPELALGVPGRGVIGLLGGLLVDVHQVALGALAIQGQPKHEVVQPPPVRLDQGTQPLAVDLRSHLSRLYTTTAT
jgi:hypothetical protein